MNTVENRISRLASQFARVEIALLGGWTALAGAIWAFLALGSEMREGELTGFDQLVLQAVRRPGTPHVAIGPHWLLECMRDVTALGGFTVLTLATVIAVIVLLAHGRRIHAALLAVCVPLAQISCDILKDLYQRPRPPFAVNGDLPASLSFPSGHSTVATATYFLLAVIVASLEGKRSTKVLAFAVAAFLSIMVGVSRVYLGVHWPSDVVAGWCLGATWALMAAVALRIIGRKAVSWPR